MFFNQPIATQTNNFRVSPQIYFRLPSPSFSLGNQMYLPALSFQQSPFAPVAKPVQPPQQRPQKIEWELTAEILCAVGLGVIIGGALVLTAAAIAALLGPRRNDTPLTAKERRIIRERDEEICFYCDNYAPNGHVDHRMSRANGGGNEPENLTWACVFCNCSKGALNDIEYISLLGSYC